VKEYYLVTMAIGATTALMLDAKDKSLIE